MRSFPGAVTVLGLAVLVSWACAGARRAGVEGRNGRRSLAPAVVVRALLGAIDRGDADAAMSLLAPEFRLRTWDGRPVVERKGYVAMLGWDLAVSGKRRVERFVVEGETVILRLRERNRFSELLRLGTFEMDVRYVVREGRIVEQRIRERTEEGKPSYTERFVAALAPLLSWAEFAAPELLARATEAGAIRYNRASAEALLELIRRYRARTEGT